MLDREGDFDDEVPTIEIVVKREEVEAVAEDDNDAEGAGEPVPEISRKLRPRTRRTRPRSKTIALKRLTRAELAEKTGFRIPNLDGTPVTPEPTAEELAIIWEIDPDNVRRVEFGLQ